VRLNQTPSRLKHEQFLKVISQELREGKMVDINSTSVCRCGERFPTDAQLQAHASRPSLSRPRQSPEMEPKVQVSATLSADLDAIEPEPLPEPLLREPRQPQPLPSLSWNDDNVPPPDSF